LANADCDTAYYCDLTGITACCPQLTTFNVDGALGHDFVCCGSVAAPCKTLTHAMKDVQASGLNGVTLNAYNGDANQNWGASETWPVVLGYGVTLKAPGIYFRDGTISDPTMFAVKQGAGDNSTSVIIEGSAGNDIQIGRDNSGIDGGISQSSAQITVDGPMNLHLINATVTNLHVDCFLFGCNVPQTYTYGVQVNAGATLTLGWDGLTGTGPVTIAGSSTSPFFASNEGIHCAGSAASPATVTDVPDGGSLTVTSEGYGIGAFSHCLVTLGTSPAFGYNPPASGFFDCGLAPYPLDQIGIYAADGTNLTLSNASFQCESAYGVWLASSTNRPADLPSATLDHVFFTKCDEAVVVAAGALTATNTTFVANHNAVTQWCQAAIADAGIVNGLIDLSGGGNKIYCNYAKPILFGSNPSIDVWNRSSKALKADNVSWLYSPTERWQCPSDFSANCICESATCTAAADGGNGFNQVISQDCSGAYSGTISDTNPSQSFCL
jgi:hypothetical protein